MDRPEVILKLALSLDGFIDDASEERLILSNDEDRKEVLELRDSVDAILIGGNTLRKDNPSLSSSNDNLIRVILTLKGDLPKDASIFKQGNIIVFCPKRVKQNLESSLNANVKVEHYSLSDSSIESVCSYLYGIGVKKLLIEGGGTLSREVIKKNLFDKIRLAYAPFFLGQSEAVNAVKLSNSTENLSKRLKLISTKELGDMVVAWYSNSNIN